MPRGAVQCRVVAGGTGRLVRCTEALREVVGSPRTVLQAARVLQRDTLCYAGTLKNARGVVEEGLGSELLTGRVQSKHNLSNLSKATEYNEVLRACEQVHNLLGSTEGATNRLSSVVHYS